MTSSTLKQAVNLRRFFVGDGPQATPFHLHRRRVFILPTRQGLAFAALLLVMLLGSMNYNNSLGFLTTFLLISMSVLTILYTNRNLLHLHLSIAAIPPVYAGEDAMIPVYLHNQGYAPRYAVNLHFPNQPGGNIDIGADSTARFDLVRATSQRGEYPVGRFVIDTVFPLGLFRCWANVETHDHFLVYPHPSDDRHLPDIYQHHSEGERQSGLEPHDFDGLKSYVPGDPLQRVHWPSYAKTGQLHVKQFNSAQAQDVWLDWTMCSHPDMEKRLSQLSRWLILARQQNLAFGLRIPGVEIAPARGDEHFHYCMSSLARFASPS